MAAKSIKRMAAASVVLVATLLVVPFFLSDGRPVIDGVESAGADSTGAPQPGSAGDAPARSGRMSRDAGGIGRWVIPDKADWASLEAGLDARGREAVEGMSAQYPLAFSELSHEQVLWADQAGYPLPQEIAMAASMTPEELDRLAELGNAKATMLAASRGMDELEKEGVFESESAMSLADKGRKLATARDRMQRALATCSPFAMHLLRRNVMLSNGGSIDPAFELGILEAIASLGDSRVQQDALALRQAAAPSLSSHLAGLNNPYPSMYPASAMLRAMGGANCPQGSMP